MSAIYVVRTLPTSFFLYLLLLMLKFPCWKTILLQGCFFCCTSAFQENNIKKFNKISALFLLTFTRICMVSNLTKNLVNKILKKCFITLKILLLILCSEIFVFQNLYKYYIRFWLNALSNDNLFNTQGWRMLNITTKEDKISAVQ